MPYRIDIRAPNSTFIDRLIELGALDVERTPDGGCAAVMPDRVTREELALALGISAFSLSPAIGRDDGSVWVLNTRPIAIGSHTIHLTDTPAFGTGLHPTTALCLDVIAEIQEADKPETLLDLGTGSGILAIAALLLGVPRATAVDQNPAALNAAAENARRNGVANRLTIVHGGVNAVPAAYPLVVANILAAPLIDMASALSRRVAHAGRLVLSGIPQSVEDEVRRAYVHAGMKCTHVRLRGGWVAIVLNATW